MELTSLIVDDEPFSRALLRGLLETNGVVVTGEAENAAEALRLAEDLRPDVLFLDVQLPGMSGMQIADVIAHLDDPPLVIFVTAFAEYAVSAFDRAAFDYIVKPVSADRLSQTLTRARRRLNSAEDRKGFANAVAEETARDSTPMRRLPIRDDYSVRLIRIEDIMFAEARDKRVFVTTTNGEYRTYYTLKRLESILPSTQFYRIHDSFIVNTNLIEEIIFLGSQTYEVRLSDKRRFPVSRSRYPDLQRRLGVE
jgi:DNA-binding LytR/AlgR family response regulator